MIEEKKKAIYNLISVAVQTEEDFGRTIYTIDYNLLSAGMILIESHYKG